MLPQLPEPICKHGYTREQIKAIIPEGQIDIFWKWMDGATMSICPGKRTAEEMEWVLKHPDLYGPWKPEDDCEIAHGAIIYTEDVDQYLRYGVNGVND